MHPALPVFTMMVTAAAALAAAAVFSGAVVLSIILIHRWRGWWRFAAFLPLLALVAWGVVIAVSISRDSTSHNLWPLELILWAAGAMLFVGLLAIARRLYRRVSRK